MWLVAILGWTMACGGDVATVDLGDSEELANDEQSALIKPKVELGELTYGGSGCKAGTADIEVKKKQVNVQFSEMAIDGDKSRAVCNLGLPFKLKKGYQLGLAKIQLLATVDPKHDATLKLAKFYPGEEGVKIETDWPPSETIDSTGFGTVWSECGQDSIARWSMEVRSDDDAEVEMLEATLKLSVRACK
jgi:hypothetical protein